MYAVAVVAVEAFKSRLQTGAAEQGAESGRRLTEVLALLPADERVDVVERAAIIEFEGRLARNEAERLAVRGLIYNNVLSRAERIGSRADVIAEGVGHERRQAPERARAMRRQT